MNKLTRWYQTRIRKHNCLNCTYLCTPNDQGTLATLTKAARDNAHERPDGETVYQDVGHYSTCYQRQWNRSPLHSDHDERMEAILRGAEQYDFAPTDVLLGDGRTWPLSNQGCDKFLPFNHLNTMSLDQLKTEQRIVNQEAKDRRRFWIITALSTATTLAVIASALFHWLEWTGGNKP